MRSPRWQKLLRDLWLNKARTAMMTVAVAVSIFAVGTMLSAYAVLTREIERNYLNTNPASATLELDSVDNALVDAVRKQPGIADAEARASVLARVRVGSDWRPLLLFVISDYNAMRIGLLRPVAGAWPPPEGTMLIERTAQQVLGAGVGDAVVVKTPHGAPRELRIAGLVHDPSLAPSTMERTGYGYITPRTLAWLGEEGVLDELRIVVAERPMDFAAVEATADKLAKWLQERGREVRQIQAPPPGQHPHQTQMTGILFLMTSFSLMALALSAILVATMVASLMTRQIREIGMMKAVGAHSGQIAGLYLAMILFFGAAALALALPLSVIAGRRFALTVADLLNFTIVSDAIPWWVFAVQAAAGLLIPLLVAAVPIVQGSRVTVRQAIDDHGVSQDAFGSRRFDALLAALRGFDRSLLLALRNTFRRRLRLVLTLGLLAAGGAMFMTASNVSQGWDRIIGKVYTTRHYDVEIRFNRPELVSPLLDRLRGIPGIRNVEAWGYTATAIARPGSIDLVRTYPDGGHGSFAILAPPATTALIDFPLLAGRWLRPGDTDAVVLNQMVFAQAPHLKVGDRIALSVGERPTNWRVAGIVEEIGSSAAAYVTDEAFARAADTTGQARMLRIATSAQDADARIALIRSVERALEEMGASVAVGIPLAELRTAMGEHIAVLIRTLLAMAVLMATVGALGLMSTMSMNVLERTREIGVMQAVGATPAAVLRVIVGEGVFVGAMSWLLAIVLAVPLSALVGSVVGRMAFRVALPLVMSPSAMAFWLVAVIVTSAIASGYPAWRASQLTVREALAHA